MRKIILTLIFILTAMFGFSQKEEPLHDNAVLIGYMSSSEEEFINVVLFIDNLNNRVIDICQEDGLILLEVCEEWKDVYELMKKIEGEFGGKCYYKENLETFFEVQKLIGDEYQIIDIVNGSGNSNQEINYEYTDNYAGIKVQYYRLKQVDYDGNFEYYGPIAVDVPLNYKYNLIIYPNPTDDKINIRLNYKGIIEKITLTTISGKEIPVGFNIKCDGETNITLATLNIENGTYLIKFSFVEGEYIHKDKIIINK